MFSVELSRIHEVIRRVSTVTQRRFGVDLYFLPLDTETCGPALRTLAEAKKIFRLDQRIYSPVYDLDRLLGFVVSAGPLATSLSKTELIMVQATIDLGLAALLSESEKLSRLGRQEILLTSGLSSVPNVLPFKKAPEATVIPFRSAKKSWPKKPCIIEADLHNDRIALALEFHELSGNVGFTYFQEIFSNLGFSWEDWLKLGACTVFIPDVQELNLDIIKKILPATDQVDYSLCPLPVIGAPNARNTHAASQNYVEWLEVMRTRTDVYHVRVGSNSKGTEGQSLFRDVIKRSFPLLS